MIFNSQQGIVFRQTHQNAGYDGSNQDFPFMPIIRTVVSAVTRIYAYFIG